MLLVPVAFLQEDEPQDGWNVIRQARDEQRRTDRQDVGEDGYRLSDNPREEGDSEYKAQPGRPTSRAIDVAGAGVGEDFAVDISAHDSRVDGAGDEDDRESDPEYNP